MPNSGTATKTHRASATVVESDPVGGVKPELVLKGGVIAWAQMGDPNASIPTPEPVYGRPMFASFGRAIASTSLTFVSKAAHDAGIGERLQLAKETVPVENTRAISKSVDRRGPRSIAAYFG